MDSCSLASNDSTRAEEYFEVQRPAQGWNGVFDGLINIGLQYESGVCSNIFPLKACFIFSICLKSVVKSVNLVHCQHRKTGQKLNYMR